MPDRRLLFITRNFPPLVGGMERLNLHALLASVSCFQVSACLPSGAVNYLPSAVRARELPLSSLPRFLLYCQYAAAKAASDLKPQVVYSGSGLTAPAALLAAKIARAESTCFLHGLDLIADHPVYRSIFLPSIRRIDRVLVNSQHTAYLAESAGVRENRISIVHPGCDLPLWGKGLESRKRFRQELSLGDMRKVILFAGRLTARKGVADFIRYSLPAIIREFPDVIFVVIGDEPKSALKNTGGALEDILKAIEQIGGASAVRLLGRVDDAMLSDAYFAADAMIFPVLNLPGDVEGFGMVAIEAAAHGLPTLGFAVGGVPDAVAQGVSGSLVASGDYQMLADELIKELRQSSESRKIDCRKHAERYSWEVFKERFISVLSR